MTLKPIMTNGYT